MQQNTQPQRDPEALQILAFDNGTGSRKWRFEGVAERINERTEKGEMFIASHAQWKGDIMGANLVVLEMLSGPHIVDECKAQGAKVIYEADDAVIDSYGRERKNLQHLGENKRNYAIETIKRCDAVVVTTEILAENYRRFTDKPVYVLPNYVDFQWYGREDLRITRNTDEIRLGWFGSKGHHEDLRMMVPVLKRILEKYSNVQFVYCGYGGMSSDKAVTEVGWGEDVFKELPRDRREFYISAPYDYWPHKHRLLDFDIGMAPLIDDYFNKCKSHIKWMEYGVLQTPTVCSPTIYGWGPFDKEDGEKHPVVKHGKTGFIAESEEEWFTYLSQLIEDANLRRTIGKAAQREVFKKWDLDKHWTKWWEVYREVAGK